MASAAVVHTVADKCTKLANTLPYCGCDKSLKDEELEPGREWGGCSPDMEFSINFTRQFVDSREDNVALQRRTFVLHNNNVGRLVSDYCICTTFYIENQLSTVQWFLCVRSKLAWYL